MSNLAIIRAEDVVPGDVICFDEPDFDMLVQQTTRTFTGYVGLYAANSEWKVYRKADDVLQIRIKPTALPIQDQQEPQQPMDWQDKLVIWGSAICGIACLAILIWGPR
jgi:hypothetical protein